ncbi:Hypothetical protein GLP15_1139 [Giardia lamblia P15]|uniref:Uncharacterized protein n=1 Tax=Giardia intestinalis (strain P15) TaxID=658858 RepID=E1F8L1_GIAIA|nr:Hypothetical protein GLP15_1139 [Giardia lamblia P15]
MALWRSVREHYDRAHAAALRGDYQRTVRHLDRCIDLLTDAYGSPVHYKLAIFYCKLGRALLRISQNPVPGSDSEETLASTSGDTSSQSRSTSSDLSTSSSSEAVDSADVKAATAAKNLRAPFDIILEKFTRALECINVSPSSIRNSTNTLLTEAEIYQSMGETALVYGRPEIEDWLTIAMGLYLRVRNPVCAELGACRFFLGKYHFKNKKLRRAQDDLTASLDILVKLELTYREKIRSLLKIEHETHFHFSAQQKLQKLRAKKHELRKQLNLIKAQIKEIDGLVQMCKGLIGPTSAPDVIPSGSLSSMQSLGLSIASKLYESTGTINDDQLSWALSSLPPNFRRLASSELSI